MVMGGLPSGTVTFLFTDLEGSTRLWEEDREAMAAAVARHDALLEDAIGRHAGVVFSHMGDGMAAAFGTAPSAVAAAVDAQLALSSEAWGVTRPLRARMGLHTGEGRIVGDQYPDSLPWLCHLFPIAPNQLPPPAMLRRSALQLPPRKRLLAPASP